MLILRKWAWIGNLLLVLLSEDSTVFLSMNWSGLKMVSKYIITPNIKHISETILVISSIFIFISSNFFNMFSYILKRAELFISYIFTLLLNMLRYEGFELTVSKSSEREIFLL